MKCYECAREGKNTDAVANLYCLWERSLQRAPYS